MDLYNFDLDALNTCVSVFQYTRTISIIFLSLFCVIVLISFNNNKYTEAIFMKVIEEETLFFPEAI